MIQTAAAQSGTSKIDGDWGADAVAHNLRRFDKGGDSFYDQISALHKSVRARAPTASLYWLVRMLDGAPIRSTSAAAWSGWRSRTSALPTARAAGRARRLRDLRALGES